MADSNTFTPRGTSKRRVDLGSGQEAEAVSVETLLSGENEDLNRIMTCPAYTATHLAANATTNLKAGAGVLHGVNLNTLGGSSNTLTVYDSLTASGTVLAIIDTTANPIPRIFDVIFEIGLTIVIGTGTACDATVSWI
jgi:hypothetical protein